MQIRELSIADAFEVTPKIHSDDRGAFLEWYRHDELQAAIGHPLDLRQANTSISKAGVVRGIHYADVPRGQAKYVTVPSGAIIDFVIDVRVGSPTFGQWDSVRLDDVERKALYLAEGLGHAFVALTDDTVVSYLVSDVYNPVAEHAINPLDETVGLEFPFPRDGLILSPKDLEAPSLHDALQAGALPEHALVAGFYDQLNRTER